MTRAEIDKRLAALPKPGRFLGVDVDKPEREALETAHELYDLLREFITPPLAYSKKQDAVAKARMLLEEWKEVER